jgi:hypothetical protein
MQETRMVKAIHSWKPISRKPIGRPKIRWEDDVRRYVQKLKVSNWKTLAQDRRRWKELVEKAKTLHKELWSHNNKISGSLSKRHCASRGCGWRRLAPNLSTCDSFTVYKNAICTQPLTAVVTCVHVSGGIFQTIILLFQ